MVTKFRECLFSVYSFDACWVESLGLEGRHAYGSSVKETIEAAQEVMAAYLHAKDGFSFLASCNINQYKDSKTVKKTLTIPSWMNDRAISMRVNFSQVLLEAFLTKIPA